MTAVTIENQALVIEKFGYWPSFHDAEVERVQLARSQPGYWLSISLWINLMGLKDASGAISKASRFWQMELEFTEVVDNELLDFNHQNVIFALDFQQDQELIVCTIDTSYGLSGSITARRVAVKSLLAITTPE